jgi:hypothetical protein
MTRTTAILLIAMPALSQFAACRRVEPRKLDPGRVLKSAVQPGFTAPADGLLTDKQIETFLRVRREKRGELDPDARSATDADPAEFAWIRTRVREAMLALESDRVAVAAAESYARGLAVLREARRSARDAKTIGRLDSEIAALERERASLRKSKPLPATVLKNAARLAPRRAEIEAAGP